jgi:hypothetical protein
VRPARSGHPTPARRPNGRLPPVQETEGRIGCRCHVRLLAISWRRQEGGRITAKRDTPAFSKSPPSLVERFDAVLERYPQAERRKMFGYPGAFVGGNLATSLFHDRWVVRLPPSEVQAATDAGASPFEPMPGKPMNGFVLVPREDVEDDARINEWVERGLARAGSMPPKK